mmetsp:Transcript_37247/g.115751  ORF Transcript_37247/g.115751 Transcript_37247/m.115751 type:complete len:313 (-) Transcript_37247:1189-2127(-)
MAPQPPTDPEGPKVHCLERAEVQRPRAHEARRALWGTQQRPKAANCALAPARASAASARAGPRARPFPAWEGRLARGPAALAAAAAIAPEAGEKGRRLLASRKRARRPNSAAQAAGKLRPLSYPIAQGRRGQALRARAPQAAGGSWRSGSGARGRASGSLAGPQGLGAKRLCLLPQEGRLDPRLGTAASCGTGCLGAAEGPAATRRLAVPRTPALRSPPVLACEHRLLQVAADLLAQARLAVLGAQQPRQLLRPEADLLALEAPADGGGEQLRRRAPHARQAYTHAPPVHELRMRELVKDDGQHDGRLARAQ